MKINKQTIIEIIIIVCVSIAISFVYNFIRTDGIRFIPTSKEELQANDDELFNNEFDNANPQNAQQQLDSIELMTDSIETVAMEQNIDSIETSISDSINNANNVRNEQLISDNTLSNAKKSSQGEYKIVTLEQVKKIAIDTTNRFIIVDARRPENYAKSHIGKAINIFPEEEENVVIEKIFKLLSKDKIIIIYCDGGSCELSHHIAGLLDNFGYPKFYIFEGGWEEWKANE